MRNRKEKPSKERMGSVFLMRLKDTRNGVKLAQTIVTKLYEKQRKTKQDLSVVYRKWKANKLNKELLDEKTLLQASIIETKRRIKPYEKELKRVKIQIKLLNSLYAETLVSKEK